MSGWTKTFPSPVPRGTPTLFGVFSFTIGPGPSSCPPCSVSLRPPPNSSIYLSGLLSEFVLSRPESSFLPLGLSICRNVFFLSINRLRLDLCTWVLDPLSCTLAHRLPRRALPPLLNDWFTTTLFVFQGTRAFFFRVFLLPRLSLTHLDALALLAYMPYHLLSRMFIR